MSKAAMTAGGPLRRFASIKPDGGSLILGDQHPAVTEGRTIFPTTVNPVGHPKLQRLLKSGHNSRKIGAQVRKGHWRGFPIFTLTLQERATCPRTCEVWNSCYGNRMPYAQRIAHGPAFEAALWDELADKQREHPDGFVIRLHILGDFYSVDYAELWGEALESYPALHLFGYTAHTYAGPIGEVIAGLNGMHPDRCAFRFSGHDGPSYGSVVVGSADATEHLICPAQTGGTDCCATCALCWHSTRTIAFLRH
jgi:hypothetical protein